MVARSTIESFIGATPSISTHGHRAAHLEGVGNGHDAARLPAALVQRAVRGVPEQPGDAACRAQAPAAIEAIAGGHEARNLLDRSAESGAGSECVSNGGYRRRP